MEALKGQLYIITDTDTHYYQLQLFHGEKNFSNTPLQYFSCFFDDELMQHIVEHTILYSILNLMSIIHLPNSRSFWNPIIGNRIIQDTMDYLKRKFQTISLEENLSIDEQLCLTKARSFLKQYLPLKPHKWPVGVQHFRSKWNIWFYDWKIIQKNA
ncbi:piggyBac transposable element-derived protein 3-like [Aphis craccivora]|uniref:PiggyBac transposable element-derived protein 3-like n=1 Tax=Aphis craccivora TaxID=307492 RepID=A0A6G0VRZ5_APHCR|nr:piggyBac transposable element-derived protein 3-like [Aphis craccivora]